VLAQLEITTRCNFDCYYCAGRLMRQGDMPYDTFTALIDRHIATYGLPKVVSLQGEGEPTLHHDFLRMAEFVPPFTRNPLISFPFRVAQRSRTQRHSRNGKGSPSPSTTV
jgi:wyosine [tRNA(Phe)-imidazoG37] synthetase (radical SAM superfamily)